MEDQVTALAEKDIRLSKLLENGDKAIVSIGTENFKGHGLVLERVENGEVFYVIRYL